MAATHGRSEDRGGHIGHPVWNRNVGGDQRNVRAASFAGEDGTRGVELALVNVGSCTNSQSRAPHLRHSTQNLASETKRRLLHLRCTVHWTRIRHLGPISL